VAEGELIVDIQENEGGLRGPRSARPDPLRIERDAERERRKAVESRKQNERDEYQAAVDRLVEIEMLGDDVVRLEHSWRSGEPTVSMDLAVFLKLVVAVSR